MMRMFDIALPGEEGGEAPSKGLFALPFMQRALEKRKAAAQAQAQALLQVRPQRRHLYFHQAQTACSCRLLCAVCGLPKKRHSCLSSRVINFAG